jgi:hypothetical protein
LDTWRSKEKREEKREKKRKESHVHKRVEIERGSCKMELQQINGNN